MKDWGETTWMKWYHMYRFIYNMFYGYEYFETSKNPWSVTYVDMDRFFEKTRKIRLLHEGNIKGN